MKIPSKVGETTLLPKIYRAGKRAGHVIYWQGEHSGNRYRARSGIVGGKEKIGVWTEVSGTNEGKVNERTPAEQARFVITAQHNRRLERGGYFLDVKNIGQKQFTAPMLAEKFVKGVTKLEFPILVQPKLNGYRCIITAKGMFTRKGKPYFSAPHIFEAVKWVFVNSPNLVLDGELYNHDYYEKLDDFGSLVRVKNVTTEDLAESYRVVEFHMYDAFHIGGESEAQELRLKRVASIVRQTGRDCICAVTTHTVTSEVDLTKAYRLFLEDNYEGAMIRFPKAPYVNDRTQHLLKYKPRQDAEFLIVAAEEGKGKRKGMLARLICALPKSAKEPTFKANVKWPDAEKIRLWGLRDKLPGKKATVSFAYLTQNGVPFHNYVEKIHWQPKI